MSAWLLGWVAALLSLFCIAILALRDPKRLRNRPTGSQQRFTALSRPWRRMWTALALFPGLVFSVLTHWAALVIWAGALTTMSWLVVLWLAKRDEAILGV